jgi:hypothetical protein
MAIPEQIQLGFQAYQEVKQELSADRTRPLAVRSLPDVDRMISDIGPLPQEALLLGLAEDGLPVLLDLVDPAPGPILVIGEGGSGKTGFLRSLARSADQFHDPGDIQFGAITPFPDEWKTLETMPGCLGVWPDYHPSAGEFLMRLISWADALIAGKQKVLLLMDGLDLMTEFPAETCRDLRWLCLHGPERHIWPVVTVNARRFDRQAHWADCFHTLIYGHVGSYDLARSLVVDPNADLAALLAGTQFSLQTGEGWLQFSIPSWKGDSR